MKKQLSYYIFVVSYIMLMASDMLSNVTFLTPYLPILSRLSIMLAFVSIFAQINKIKKKDIPTILFLSITSIIFFFLEQRYLCYLLIFLAAYKRYDFDDFIKKIFMARLILTISIILMSIIGITKDYNMYRAGGVVRYSLGFAHPNRLAACILELTIEAIYILKNKINFKTIIAVAIIAIVSNIITDSRSTFYIFIFIICGLIIYLLRKQKTEQKHKSILQIITYLPLLLFASSLLLSIIFPNTDSVFLKNIDLILTHRIRLMAYSFQDVGLTLIGGKPEITTDNAYMQALINGGIIFSIFFIATYLKGIKNTLKDKDYVFFIILIAYSVFGFFESYLIRVTYNAFIIPLIFSFKKDSHSLKPERQK